MVIAGADARLCNMKEVQAMKRHSSPDGPRIDRGLAGIVCAALCAGSPASAQPAQAERIVIEYVEPTNSAHKPLYAAQGESGARARAGAPGPGSLAPPAAAGSQGLQWRIECVVLRTPSSRFATSTWTICGKRQLLQAAPGIAREDAFVGPPCRHLPA